MLGTAILFDSVFLVSCCLSVNILHGLATAQGNLGYTFVSFLRDSLFVLRVGVLYFAGVHYLKLKGGKHAIYNGQTQGSRLRQLESRF